MVMGQYHSQLLINYSSIVEIHKLFIIETILFQIAHIVLYLYNNNNNNIIIIIYSIYIALYNALLYKVDNYNVVAVIYPLIPVSWEFPAFTYFYFAEGTIW